MAPLDLTLTKPTPAVPTSARPPLGGAATPAVVARAQAGDAEAFETICAAYQTAIYNYVYRLMGSADDAYDLTQDTFLKAWLNIDRTAPDLLVGAWLYRIATNVCLDELRHRKLVRWQPWSAFVAAFHPAQVAPDGIDHPEYRALACEETEAVHALLQRLPSKYRAVLLLREYAEMSYDEIGAAMGGVTRPAIKSLLFRAREEFRRLWPAPPPPPQPRTPRPHAGGALRRRRVALGVTAERLSLRARVSEWTISKLEGAAVHRTPPTPALARLQAVLDRLEAQAAEAAQQGHEGAAA